MSVEKDRARQGWEGEGEERLRAGGGGKREEGRGGTRSCQNRPCVSQVRGSLQPLRSGLVSPTRPPRGLLMGATSFVAILLQHSLVPAGQGRRFDSVLDNSRLRPGQRPVTHTSVSLGSKTGASALGTATNSSDPLTVIYRVHCCGLGHRLARNAMAYKVRIPSSDLPPHTLTVGN